MTYYGGKELAEAFRTVRKNTLVIAEEIPEDQYGFVPAKDMRPVGKALVHIVLSTRLAEQIHGVEKLRSFEGFDFFGFMGKIMEEEQKPRTKAEILQMLRENGERVSAWLEGLTDDFLAERVTYPPGMTPPSKTRFEMLLGLKEHEMHHRGQLMLVERMLGIVPHLTRQMQARIEEMQKQQAQATA